MSDLKELKIDVVSDVVCPWCAIGYKNLETAVQRLQGDIDIDLQWHAYELNPDTPAGGNPHRQMLKDKYGMSDEQYESNHQRITDMGAQAGFEFNFRDEMRTSNTFDCHRLLLWAKDSGHQTDLKMAFFQAYFTDTKDVNDRSVILDAVAQAGLDVDAARAVLESDQYAAEVRAEEERYQQLGIQSVPTYIVNDQYAISGGQPPEVFEQALRQIADEMSA